MIAKILAHLEKTAPDRLQAELPLAARCGPEALLSRARAFGSPATPPVSAARRQASTRLWPVARCATLAARSASPAALCAPDGKLASRAHHIGERAAAELLHHPRLVDLDRWDLSDLPAYQPSRVVSGTIRIGKAEYLRTGTVMEQ